MSISFIFYGFFCLLQGEFNGSKSDHAVYISVIEIEYQKSNQAEIRLKIFYDDLQDALLNQFGKKVDLSRTEDCTEHQALITDYLNKHFQASINGETVSYSYKKCEKLEDTVWMYYSAKVPRQWVTVEIKADYLMELFPTQSNVVNITVGKVKKYFRLTKDNVTEKVSLTD